MQVEGTLYLKQVDYQIFTQPMQLIFTLKKSNGNTSEKSTLRGYNNVMLLCIQSRALVYYSTSLLCEKLFRHNENFINIPVKMHIKPQHDLMRCINQSSRTRIAYFHSCCLSHFGSSSSHPPGVSLHLQQC